MKWGTTPPPPKFFFHPSPPPPQTSPPNGNKKHEVVKANARTPFTQHKCQQIKKIKSNLKK